MAGSREPAPLACVPLGMGTLVWGAHGSRLWGTEERDSETLVCRDGHRHMVPVRWEMLVRCVLEERAVMEVLGRRCGVLMMGLGAERPWWGLEHPVLGRGLHAAEERVWGAAAGALRAGAGVLGACGSSGLSWLSSAPSQDGGAATSSVRGAMWGRGRGPHGAGGQVLAVGAAGAMRGGGPQGCGGPAWPPAEPRPPPGPPRHAGGDEAPSLRRGGR